MRFLLAVAVLAGLSVIGTAQEQPRQFKAKAAPKSKIETAPKSTAAVKAPRAGNTSSTSKELYSVENEHAKGSGTAHTPKKSSATLKPAKERPAPPINFNGKNGAGGGTRSKDPYRGRLKQKGTSHRH